jgi:Protein of unknown function (DUF1264)
MGRRFHTWQYDRDDFPYGIPQLMMGFTQDGQADEALIRDRRLGVSAARKRQNRADIPDPAVLPGANSWQSGRTVQTRLEEMDSNRGARAGRARRTAGAYPGDRQRRRS